MLRLRFDNTIPAVVEKLEHFTISLKVVEETGKQANLPRDLQYQLAWELLTNDDLQRIPGEPILSIHPVDDPESSTISVSERNGKCRVDCHFSVTCNRQHYSGSTHTAHCFHKMLRPVCIRFRVEIVQPRKGKGRKGPPMDDSGFPTILPIVSTPIMVVKVGDAAKGVDTEAALARAFSDGLMVEDDMQRQVVEVAGHAVQVVERPDAHYPGYGGRVWDAAYLLTRHLEEHQELVRGRRVVELGAGVSLVGIAAALLGGIVTVTDMDHTLDLARANVAANAKALGQSSGRVEVKELAWGDAEHASALSPPFDVILASDVVYQDELFSIFIESLHALSSMRSTILLSARERHGCDFELFLRLLEEKFTVAEAALGTGAAALAETATIGVTSLHPREPRLYVLKRRD